MEVQEKNEQLMIINKFNNNLGDLFDVKFKVYDYYNEKRKKVKTFSKPVHKTFIKQIKKNEYDGDFQKGCWITDIVSGSVGILSAIGSASLAVICPPAAICAAVLCGVSGAVSLGSLSAEEIKNVSEYLSNKEFNEQKVIEEILIEEEENQ